MTAWEDGNPAMAGGYYDRLYGASLAVSDDKPIHSWQHQHLIWQLLPYIPMEPHDFRVHHVIYTFRGCDYALMTVYRHPIDEGKRWNVGIAMSQEEHNEYEGLPSCQRTTDSF